MALLIAAACLWGWAVAEEIREEDAPQAQTGWLEAAQAAQPVAEDEPLAVESAAGAGASAPVIKDKDTIREAQQRLIDLGLLKGKADGIAGPKTEAALKAFQAQAGLPETGRLDADTFEALKRYEPASLVDVQQRLIDLGYLQGTADGKWGSRSSAAMKLFQQLHELEATGNPDSVSVAKLNSADAIAMPARLGSGDEGDEVLKLQQRLYDFGFMTDKPDGVYGKSTVAAVKAFQQRLIDQELARSFEIAANGEATPITQLILYNAAYSTYLHDVALGDTCDEALRIERRLVSLGYMDMPADDTLDEYAVEALDLFKVQAGVLTFGGADKAAIDALFSANAPEAVHCAWHAIAAGDKGLTVRAAEEALVYGGMLSQLPEGSYDKDMTTAVGRLHDYLKARGSDEAALFENPESLSREAVEALLSGLLDYVADVGGEAKKNEAEAIRVQRRLYAMYYLPRNGVDGKWGSQSRDALKQFQTTNGLEATGVADRATQEVLFSGEALDKRFPWRIEVSLADQRVNVYQLNADNGYDQVQSFICSTGLHDATPHGVFLDGHPLNRWHYFQKFFCWAQYSYIIEGDIMFHSVLYRSKNEKSLTGSSVRNLGRPASHGCVRLRVEDAKWLFENCKRGDVVIIIS